VTQKSMRTLVILVTFAMMVLVPVKLQVILFVPWMVLVLSVTHLQEILLTKSVMALTMIVTLLLTKT